MRNTNLKGNLDNFKADIYSGIPYFYAKDVEIKNTFRMNVELIEEIDYEILRRATDKAEERYPYLMVKVVENFAKIYLKSNKEKLVIKNTDKSIPVGGKEANNHLIAISYFENKLHFNFFHGLVDATGGLNFIKTILYYYCKEKYDENLSSEGIRVLEDEIEEEEYVDPLLSLDTKEEVKPIVELEEIKIEDTFHLISDPRVNNSKKCMVHFLTITEESIMKYCKENDGSPAVVFSLLLARTIDSLNPGMDKKIVSSFAQNQRSIIGRKKAYQSLVGSIRIAYDEKIRKANFELQNTAYRSKIFIQNDAEVVKSHLSKMMAFFKILNAIPMRKVKESILAKGVNGAFGKMSYVVSYVGKSGLKGCKKYVKTIFSEADACETGILLEINTANYNFCLAFMQEFESDLYFKEFCKQIESLGVSYNYLGSKELDNPDYALKNK